MAVPWIRRLGPLAMIGAVALVASGCVTFTGTKEVTGGESDGPFVVRITCEGTEPETEDLTFNGEDTQVSGEFDFDTGTATCTITEIEQAGATSVTYECGETSFVFPLGAGGAEDAQSGGGPGMSVVAGAEPGIECSETADGLIVEVTSPVPVEISVSFTVINDFTPPPTPTTAPPAPAPAPAAAGGEARFTG